MLRVYLNPPKIISIILLMKKKKKIGIINYKFTYLKTFIKRIMNIIKYKYLHLITYLAVIEKKIKQGESGFTVKVPNNYLDLWVVSHGGVASNALCDFLEENGIKVRSSTYPKYCHKKHPLSPIGIPILVVYGDFKNAIISMDRRNFLKINSLKMIYDMDPGNYTKIFRFLGLTQKNIYSANNNDPVGLLRFLNSFFIAKKNNLDQIEFLKYPYNYHKLKLKLKTLGFDIDCSNYKLRERTVNENYNYKYLKQIINFYSGKDKSINYEN